MSDNNTYYQRNKERLLERARNHYHQQGGKEKAKKYGNNKVFGNKREVNIENYLMMKRI